MSEIFNEEGRVVPGVNTTCDVGPDEIQKQAKKLGFKVSKDGVPEAVLESKRIEILPRRWVVMQPSKRDLVSLLEKGTLRGSAIKGDKGWDVYVWVGRTLSHWNLLNELIHHHGYMHRPYFSFKLAKTPDALGEDRNWRDETPIDCGGFYGVFGGDMDCKASTVLTTDHYLAKLFNRTNAD